MIVVTATLRFRTRADRDAALEASVPIQAATRTDEPGCQLYCFAADPVQDTDIAVHELWDDADTLAAHFAHPNYLEMVAMLTRASGFVSSDNAMFLAEPRGPVYDDTGTFRAAALAPPDPGGPAA